MAGALVCCALQLHAQTAPTITTQPASQTNLAGSNVTFTVAVDGTGPFSYQWQLNGTYILTNIITTVAGNGTNRYGGDGGAATNASLNDPTGVVLDGSGNLYIADRSNQRVRKMDPNGIITTVAGNGATNFSGDGGAATNAGLYYPSGVGLDAAGNLYIGDQGHYRIRKVDTNGIITTVAGNGTSGYAGNGGQATSAKLAQTAGVALDGAGNLFIAGLNDNVVRKVDINGIITTVAGTGVAGPFSGDGGAATSATLDDPYDVALDASGNLYIADSGDYRIRKVNPSGVINTVAGSSGPFGFFYGDGGAATNAGLYWPSGVVLDFFGNLYMADSLHNRIRKVDTNGIITTVAGGATQGYSGDGGAATAAGLFDPSGVTLDASGNLYIADTANNRIREVHFAGYPTLTLTNVSTNNAGNYTVVVTSPYGCVTNLIATLTVLVPPQIMTGDGFFGVVGNQLGFNVSATAGQTIVVDGSADLVNWTPLCTNTAGGNPFYFCDPCWTNFPWRFYRARMQ